MSLPRRYELVLTEWMRATGRSCVRVLVDGDASRFAEALRGLISPPGYSTPPIASESNADILLLAMHDSPGHPSFTAAMTRLHEAQERVRIDGPRIIILINRLSRLAPELVARIARTEIIFQVMGAIQPRARGDRSRKERRASKILSAIGISVLRVGP